MFGIRQGPEKCYVTKREIIVIPRKAEALNGNLKKHKT
jgi:hypothetical protein